MDRYTRLLSPTITALAVASYCNEVVQAAPAQLRGGAIVCTWQFNPAHVPVHANLQRHRQAELPPVHDKTVGGVANEFHKSAKQAIQDSMRHRLHKHCLKPAWKVRWSSTTNNVHSRTRQGNQTAIGSQRLDNVLVAKKTGCLESIDSTGAEVFMLFIGNVVACPPCSSTGYTGASVNS